MFRKLITATVLSAIAAPALFTAGCASANQGEKPYSLTGTRNVNTPGSFQDKMRYSDQKGRYHPEWVGQTGR